MRKTALILFAILMCTSLRAQFNLSENDPAKVKWMSVQTDNFRVVYPVGCDSLAQQYLAALERFRPMVANSIGMVQGQFQKNPLDVILHTSNVVSNGYVGWTPSRMEMLTFPQWDQSSALPWITQLAVHEGRHAAQMQMGYRHIFRPFRYITGQIIAGAVNAYPGSLLDEGDAVVAETALTHAGRGRDARFLARYMYSFDNGDTRNYPAWRFGSIYRPTPNNYALGYAMISGARVLYGAPYFMADYFDYISRRPYDPWPLRHALRRASGKKFMQNFADIMDVHYKAWAADTLARGPFMPARQISKKARHMVEYVNPNADGNGVQYWVKHDIYRNPYLVKMDSLGREKRLVPMPYTMGSIGGNDSLFVWNEVRTDRRWGQVNGSVIREYDVNTGRKRTVTKKGDYVEPFPVNDTLIAAISHTPAGTSAIVLINRMSGEEQRRIPAPAGLQLYAVDYLDGVFYTSAVCESGMGIWQVADNRWDVVLEPVPVQMESLDVENGQISFESDHNGSWELYSYNLQEKQLYRISSTKYGGVDFNRLHNGDLAFSQMEGNSVVVKYTVADQLNPQKVDWKDYHHYAVADELSRQEDTLVFEQRLRHPRKVNLESQTEFSQPERYRKGAHAFRIHSWAPLYVNMDAVNDLSLDQVQNIASLGASAWFQNSMSTLYGQLAYKAAPDSRGRWFHSGHLQLTYSGLYPVFEFQTHVNDGHRFDYSYGKDPESGKTVLYQKETADPFVSLSLRTYVPLRKSNGIVSFGFIPQLSLRWNNNRFQDRTTFLMSVSARGYVMSRTPSAAVYPRFGIGAEFGWISPYAYAYFYGYVPGIAAGQGIKLSATVQKETELSTSKLFVAGYTNILPRGYADMSIAGFTREGFKLTADYAIPFYMGDWHIGSAFLCKRGIVTPHFDFAGVDVVSGGRTGRYPAYSVGCAFEMEFGSFFWVKVPVRIGVTTSYNGGPLVPDNNHRLYSGLLFNIEIPN